MEDDHSPFSFLLFIPILMFPISGSCCSHIPASFMWCAFCMCLVYAKYCRKSMKHFTRRYWKEVKKTLHCKIFGIYLVQHNLGLNSWNEGFSCAKIKYAAWKILCSDLEDCAAKGQQLQQHFQISGKVPEKNYKLLLPSDHTHHLLMLKTNTILFSIWD